jgi:hypothetical protein
LAGIQRSWSENLAARPKEWAEGRAPKKYRLEKSLVIIVKRVGLFCYL